MSEDKHLPGALNTIVTVIAASLCLYVILYVSHTFDRFDIGIQEISHRSIFVTFLIVLSLMVLPIRKGDKKDRLPWYDITFILLGIAGPLYNALFWVSNANRIGLLEFYPWEIALAFLTILVVLEITRRVIGLAMPLFAIFFLVHMFFGQYFPSFLATTGTSMNRALAMIVYSASGIYGTPIGVASTVIVLFVLFGAFLFVTPAGSFFMDLAMALFGYVRGGPAKVAVVSSALFGTLSGSPMANVAVTGTFTIPLMKKIGYNPSFAGAVESVASTGGLIMPPVMGAVAFIMADWLGISYWAVCVAAFLPALLYYVAIFFMVDAEAVKLGLRGLPRAECPSLKATLKNGWSAVVPLVVLVLLMGGLRYSAQYSALYAMAVLLVINRFSKKGRLGTRQFVSALRAGGLGVISAGNACACAGLIIGALSISQFGIALSDIIVTAAAGNMWILLGLAAVTCFVLGMGMPSIPAYMMVVIFVAPALLKFGVSPLAAHMFIFYWAMVSFFTPPVAGACFVASGISGANTMKIGMIAMRLGMIAYIVPFMFVADTSLLFQGSLISIAIHSITALMGTIVLSWGLSGQSIKYANFAQRMLFMTGGLLFLWPLWSSDLIGLAVSGIGLLWQLRTKVMLKVAPIQ